MTTTLFHHPIFEEHRTPDGHPERSSRLAAIHDHLKSEEFSALDFQEAPIGDLSHFEKVHDAQIVDAIIQCGKVLQEQSLNDPDALAQIDADTFVSPASLEAMQRLIGALSQGIDGVFEAKINNAFVAARPPGHHAERQLPMGFCLLNGIAAAARYAQSHHGAERVAIVDWDVHHGNGTQDIFYDDPSVMFLSTHQMPLFPGSGAKRETGEHGNIVNAPLRAGDDGTVFKEAFSEVVLKAIDNFKPDVILISAGFDAHHADPLGGLKLTEEDFDWATGNILDKADAYCQGRVVSVLEGGYDLKGLAGSAGAHIARLMTNG